METKKRIDTGIRNNPSTGDVLADGGDKINANFDSLYNTLGDQRLFGTNFGVDKQVLHATGYYQKHPPIFYTTAVAMGSKHDVDTTTGTVSILLPPVKVGECVEIINSNGSISSKNPLRIQTELSDSFMGGSREMIFRTPNSRIVLWGVSVDRGRGVWRHSVDNLFYSRYNTVDIEETISTVGNDFPIAHVDDYRVMKFLTYFRDSISGKSRSSEILLHINNIDRTIFYTEYAVVGNTDIDIIKIDFTISGDDISLRVQSKIGNNGRFVMRAIQSI